MRTKEFDEDEIVKKAIALFWQKGYNATSLHDLLEGLGIARSSLYHTFGDKHSLYLKALDAYQQEATKRIVRVILESSSVKEGITQLLRAVVEEVQADRPKGCFAVNAAVEVASSDQEVQALVCNDNITIENALTSAIEQAQREHQIRPDKNPRALARFLCNTITGMRVYSKIKQDEQFFEDVVKTALSVLD